MNSKKKIFIFLLFFLAACEDQKTDETTKKLCEKKVGPELKTSLIESCLQGFAFKKELVSAEKAKEECRKRYRDVAFQQTVDGEKDLTLSVLTSGELYRACLNGTDL
ncbi:MAG: hypothetical protein CL678_04770 [Bdellovibrionaceae bacterium]|nr:hypothetical protein [Pseudobdellovibrionaceae bacterium]|tara:strand:+ start:930 stop:1250 length:321 start_codon:yes stop_codon:yes gene_type:complete